MVWMLGGQPGFQDRSSDEAISHLPPPLVLPLPSQTRFFALSALSPQRGGKTFHKGRGKGARKIELDEGKQRGRRERRMDRVMALLTSDDHHRGIGLIGRRTPTLKERKGGEPVQLRKTDRSLCGETKLRLGKEVVDSFYVRLLGRKGEARASSCWGRSLLLSPRKERKRPEQVGEQGGRQLKPPLGNRRSCHKKRTIFLSLLRFHMPKNLPRFPCT